MTPLIALGALIVFGLLGVIAWKVTRLQNSPGGSDEELVRMNAELKANLEKKSEEVGTLKAALDAERAEMNQRQGKSKELFATFTKLEAKYESLLKERDTLKKQLTKFETEQEQREREFDVKLQKLEAVNTSLAQERQRVIREDEERLRLQEEERDRLWADHENGVISTLTDLCKQPLFSFTAYSNTNLPDGFDGSLKPDFMIEFLGQYVIFDAKVSKAKSLKAYIDKQIKDTVAKVKDDDRIYKTIFLVVPTTAVAELKSHHYIIDGYSLFVISPEALAPLLASFKRISMYEFAEQFDPQQRENIIQYIAELDFQLSVRNANDIIMSKLALQVLEKAQKLDPQTAADIALKKQPMVAKVASAVSPAELKRIVSSLITQDEELQKLVSPSAPVKKKELKMAERLLSETLFE